MTPLKTKRRTRKKGGHMNLVFLEPNKIDAVPFTTSDVIAEQAKINYRSVQRVIENQIERLEKFGRVRFQITPFETKGGLQNKKIYHLNEEQSTLLITFLKNTDIVADFKVELVRQFYLMRAELTQRKINRIQGKPLRRELTDIIRDKPDHGDWDFKMYTDLAYILVTGRSAAKLRRERNAPREAVAADYLTAEEIERVNNLTPKIGMLYELGMDYKQIKFLLLERLLVAKSS